MAAGALGYVIKSRITLDLMAAISEAHAGRTFVSLLTPPRADN
jgi:DNA-binding NarL/FixJ family response regulator